MKTVKQYLKEYIDENVEIKNCRSEIISGLPLLLKAAFDYYELTILGEKTLLLKPVEKQTAYRLKSWTKQIEKHSGMSTVLLMDDATPYMIKKMISDRVAFIIPKKQISMPFLVMVIKTERKAKHREIRKFSPSTQLIFLFILYSESDKFTIDEVASALNLSKMSAQRGLSYLESLGLLSHEIEGKTGRKKVFERLNQKVFYEEGKVYLDNPVRSTVYVKHMPDEECSVISGLSALADQTMLGEPAQRCYALWSGYRNRIESYLVTEEQAIEESLPSVQLMKYDVEILSRNNYVDPITLICGLSEKDERIEMSIDELMKEYTRKYIYE